MNSRSTQMSIMFVALLLTGCSTEKPNDPSSDDPAQLFLLGDAHFDRGEYDDAIAAYSETIKDADPDLRSMAYNNRGLAYVRKHDHDRAVLDFSNAIDLKPGFLEAYLNRGGARYELGQFKEAAADCTQAIALSPNNSNIYRNRAMAYRAMGDDAKAEADGQKASQIDNENK